MGWRPVQRVATAARMATSSACLRGQRCGHPIWSWPLLTAPLCGHPRFPGLWPPLMATRCGRVATRVARWVGQRRDHLAMAIGAGVAGTAPPPHARTFRLAADRAASAARRDRTSPASNLSCDWTRTCPAGTCAESATSPSLCRRKPRYAVLNSGNSEEKDSTCK